MGYTHYWNTTNTKETLKGFVDALPQILEVLKEHHTLLDTSPEKAIDIPEAFVQFNGINDEGHETFYFKIGRNDFCKTARKPYDLPVMECLLVFAAHVPGMVLKSDGKNFDGSLEEDLHDIVVGVEKKYGLDLSKVL